VDVQANFRPPLPIPTIGTMSSSMPGVLSASLILGVISTQGQSYPGAAVYDSPLTLQAFSIVSGESGANLASSLLFLVGDFYRWPQPEGLNLTLTIPVLSIISAVSGANQTVPMAYFFGTINTMASVSQGILGNSVTPSVISTFAGESKLVSNNSSTFGAISVDSEDGVRVSPLSLTYAASTLETPIRRICYRERAMSKMVPKNEPKKRATVAGLLLLPLEMHPFTTSNGPFFCRIAHSLIAPNFSIHRTSNGEARVHASTRGIRHLQNHVYGNAVKDPHHRRNSLQ
jgi:hypothetical protein